MAVLEIEHLLNPISDAEPCGPNLEYDPDFGSLERAVQGKSEQVIGDKVIPGAEPDWGDVREKAQALLNRTRDLRVAVWLTAALAGTEGWRGIAAGLALIRGLLDRYWDSVHPQLDAEDDNDPTFRVNSLLGLASPELVLRFVRDTPVVQSRALGRFNLRHLRLASGKLQLPAGSDESPVDQAQIDAAFMDCDLESLTHDSAAIGQAVEELAAIDQIMTREVAGSAPDLRALAIDLSEVASVVRGKLNDRTGHTTDASPGAAAAQISAASGPGSGEIRNREDVVRAIDRICDYYRRNEPSSPVPLLLQRAKRLVARDFLDIIRDLTPAGVAEAELIGGVEKKED